MVAKLVPRFIFISVLALVALAIGGASLIGVLAPVAGITVKIVVKVVVDAVIVVTIIIMFVVEVVILVGQAGGIHIGVDIDRRFLRSRRIIRFCICRTTVIGGHSDERPDVISTQSGPLLDRGDDGIIVRGV